MSSINPNAKLENCTLRDALRAAYWTVLAAFAKGNEQQKPTPELLGIVIPGMVFNLGVRAGWLELPDGNGDARKQRDRRGRVVQLGDYSVDEYTASSFMAVLRSCALPFTTSPIEPASPLSYQEQLASFPPCKNPAARRALLQEYRERTKEAEKRVTYREIAKRAQVDDSDFKKWRSGHLPSKSIKAQRIECMLHWDGVTVSIPLPSQEEPDKVLEGRFVGLGFYANSGFIRRQLRLIGPNPMPTQHPVK